jgi:hypothetical protein
MSPSTASITSGWSATLPKVRASEGLEVPADGRMDGGGRPTRARRVRT